MIYETERLYTREMEVTDIQDLSLILQDQETMYAYEHAFSDIEVEEWLNKQRQRYQNDGFGLWAVIEKKTNKMIGQCGLTMQKVKGKEVLEIGYLFNKQYWHQGYATEAAIGAKQYAFTVLHAKEVYSIIRDTNIASMNVAIRNGMHIKDRFIKHYYQMDMPHYLFVCKRQSDFYKHLSHNKQV